MGTPITPDYSELLPRLASDSDKAYTRLVEYALSPPDERGPTPMSKRWGVGVQTAQNMIVRNDFAARVKTWDTRLAAATTDAMRASVYDHTRDLVAQHVQIWARVRELATESIIEFADRGGKLNPTQALAYLEASFKAERLLQGSSTENVAVALQTVDTSALTIDELREFGRLLAKTGVGG